MTSDVEYIMMGIQLSTKEAKNAARFTQKHRKCRCPIEPTFAPVKYVVSFYETSAGSFVKISCEKCGKEKHISDDVRSNW
ncbi:MAG: hypothetical protein JSW06_01580 [Thermoplasmatales archaeon]|nr:MAG: hypothetical protein JSW06_01580 [Thermoplasmatales archaeon]